MQTLTITRPDDFHLHVRDNTMMQSVVNYTAARFARAIIMPNLLPPVVTTKMASAYRDRILAAVDRQYNFEPLMTLYLTDNTSAGEIRAASQSGFVHAVKYYPAGATTHSDQGITAIEKTYPALEALSECGLPLLVHGEINDNDTDIFDRETRFIDKILVPLTADFPDLKIVLEHITTAAAVDFIVQTPGPVAATITPQHLLLNRNALFNGGLRPHHYCLPILKREADRKAILTAATSGNPKFFLGTDSAPHARGAKESHCGCAGVFSAPVALELYTEAFDKAGTLDRLEAFSAHYGADFYELPRNKDRITLIRREHTIPTTLPFETEELVPFRAGDTCTWQIKH